MDITLYKSKLVNKQSKVTITGSKSETNRLLLLQALYPKLKLSNVSNSDDSVLMAKALGSESDVVDIHHAGTAMRFLTAYFSIQEGREVTLTGSKRMTERPIKLLVEALQTLGADIVYLEHEGYPPIKIKGKQLTNHKVSLKANVSSQYISALLLIASRLENGIELYLEGEITSIPYIKMTLSLLDEIGVESTFVGHTITVKPKIQEVTSKTLTVESDWSSASYYFSIVALSDVGTEITLSSYKANSLQGDSCLVEFYKSFGVETKFFNNKMTLLKSSIGNPQSSVDFDLTHAPDIAQTIAVTCFALGKACNLTGLHTLKIKETDRLVALKTEIEKLGGEVSITEKSLHLLASKQLNAHESIETYNDHRMAMAFAPLALKTPITIKDAMVVSKSYPTFWNDLQSIGFQITK
ncbi:3-phosphoshikimate 1-carboxyvinyltransferase [Aestuariivivens sediminis]|uniref:3-phosphoshikimate 1-carboxyvinyltransferase n=1 Tax=Aestuariivivens sediminis TaxID=2913557 RepID=UPI001F577E44|nr:3-phosphoshikimate 1-carboxyvinyltransferase [Aestuariivivens sediminis]